MSYVDERDKAAEVDKIKSIEPMYERFEKFHGTHKTSDSYRAKHEIVSSYSSGVYDGFKAGHDHGAFQSEVVRGLVEALREINEFVVELGHLPVPIVRSALSVYAQAKKEAGVE